MNYNKAICLTLQSYLSNCILLIERGNFKCFLLTVHKPLFAKQNLFRFHMVNIRYTTVHRANRRTLRLLVKPFTLRTFIGNNVVNSFIYRRLQRIGIRRPAAWQHHLPF